MSFRQMLPSALADSVFRRGTGRAGKKEDTPPEGGVSSGTAVCVADSVREPRRAGLRRTPHRVWALCYGGRRSEPSARLPRLPTSPADLESAGLRLSARSDGVFSRNFHRPFRISSSLNVFINLKHKEWHIVCAHFGYSYRLVVYTRCFHRADCARPALSSRSRLTAPACGRQVCGSRRRLFTDASYCGRHDVAVHCPFPEGAPRTSRRTPSRVVLPGTPSRANRT